MCLQASLWPRLRSRGIVARAAIDTTEAIGIAAITPWEIAMLVAMKRLELDRDVLVWLKQALALPRVGLITLSPEVTVARHVTAADLR